MSKRQVGPFQVVEEEDEAIGTVSMVLMGALFLACFCGAFFLFGNDSSAPTASGPGVVTATSAFVKQKQQPTLLSAVDSTCGRGWQEGMSNVDELYCYMTTSVSRLCDAEERKHLVHTIARFEKDYAQYQVRFNVAATSTMVSAYTQSFSIGLEEARTRDPNVSAEVRREREIAFLERMSGVMAPVSKVQTEKVNQIGHYKLEPALTALASKGFLSEKEFPGRQPRWVARALGQVQFVNPVCPS